MSSRGLTKKELEELRKKEEEEAAAHVFKEFVETFQEVPSTTSKVWVKAGTYDAGARRRGTSERGKLYKPTSRLDEKRGVSEADIVRSLVAPRPEPPRVRAKQRSGDKKKSNLGTVFKENSDRSKRGDPSATSIKCFRERGAWAWKPASGYYTRCGILRHRGPNTTNPVPRKPQP
ncbi:hypothetical protein evm_014219 [Chilo suppressalis]|nr:hypothetical protein evm_014219 [Chilo suppressalis]